MAPKADADAVMVPVAELEVDLRTSHAELQVVAPTADAAMEVMQKAAAAEKVDLQTAAEVEVDLPTAMKVEEVTAHAEVEEGTTDADVDDTF